MCNGNIIFVVLTSYQLYVALVYSEYIRTKYGSKYRIHIVNVGVDLEIKIPDLDVFVIPNLNTNRIKRLWQRLYWGGRLFPFNKLNRLFSKEEMNYLFVFNDNEPITNKLICHTKELNTNNKVIIIEEGIGIYERSVEEALNWKQKVRYMITMALGSPMQYSAVGDNYNIDYAIVEKPEIYFSTKKARKQQVIKQNKNRLFSRAEFYLRALGKESLKLSKHEVLFIGQPFNEFDNIVKEEETFLKNIFRIISKKQLRVLIKPHPREKTKKYQQFLNEYIEICDKEISVLPIECLVNAVDAKIVITFNSSAGVNIGNNRRDIDCYFCYKMAENKQLLQIWSNGYTTLNDEIFEGTSGNMFVPTTLDELEEQICNSVENKSNNSEDTVIVSEGFEEIDSILF